MAVEQADDSDEKAEGERVMRWCLVGLVEGVRFRKFCLVMYQLPLLIYIQYGELSLFGRFDIHFLGIGCWKVVLIF